MRELVNLFPFFPPLFLLFYSSSTFLPVTIKLN